MGLVIYVLAAQGTRALEIQNAHLVWRVNTSQLPAPRLAQIALQAPGAQGVRASVKHVQPARMVQRSGRIQGETALAVLQAHTAPQRARAHAQAALQAHTVQQVRLSAQTAMRVHTA
jgi:hypothetical protein